MSPLLLRWIRCRRDGETGHCREGFSAGVASIHPFRCAETKKRSSHIKMHSDLLIAPLFHALQAVIKILSSSWCRTTHADSVLLGSDCNIQFLGVRAQWLLLCSVPRPSIPSCQLYPWRTRDWNKIQVFDSASGGLLHSRLYLVFMAT
jgi:hypothetical protein